MTPQELKNSILQLAIQGRLVEQRPEEGTAEELYRQIQREKIGTDLTNPDISEDEIPFDIPDTWKWVRVCNIAVLYNGRAYKQAELLSSGKYPVLRVGNLFTNNQWYYSDLELEDEKYCQKGDLIYAWSASFGPHIWDGDRVIYHYHIWKIVHSSFLYQKYLYYFLLADTESIKQSGHGLAMIHVTKAGTEQRLVPLPPLAEQKRIVVKIEELLPYIDRYEKAWSRLEDFNKRFPTDMQKSILQLAIQGKLVEQHPEEGTAEELFYKIQKERIETDKEQPQIGEDEFEFDIPDTWKWVRIKNIAVLINGRAYKQSELQKSGKYPILRVGNLFTNPEWYYSDMELDPDKYCNSGDLLYSWSASFGPHIWTGNKVIYHYHIWKIVHSEFVFQKYLYYFLLADTDSIKRSGHGLAMIHVTKTGTEQRLIPLPPIAEQKRIVAKLEELLPLCEKLR